MKNLLLLGGLLAASFTATAQQTPGKSIPEYTTKLGTVLHKGDTLVFGLGQRPDGSFRYANIGPTMLAPTGLAVPKTWAGLRAPIKDIKQTKLNNGTGFRTVVVFKSGVYNAALEIDAAEESGEIKTANNQKKATPTSGGVADELLKLKALLDTGVITQAEFDSQKAKLLR